MPRTSFSRYRSGPEGWLVLPLAIVWLICLLPFALMIRLLGVLIPDKPNRPH